MLIFENWLQEEHDVDVLDILEPDTYSAYFNEYLEYEKAFPLTKSYEESLTFLQSHPLFKGEFDKCIIILCEDLDSELILEVDGYYYDETAKQEIKAHFSSYDVFAKNYKEGIIKLAHKIEANIK